MLERNIYIESWPLLDITNWLTHTYKLNYLLAETKKCTKDELEVDFFWVFQNFSLMHINKFGLFFLFGFLFYSVLQVKVRY